MRTASSEYRRLCALAAVLTLCAGAIASPAPHNLSRYEFKSPHMGTLFTITLCATNALIAEQAADAAFKRIAALEDTLSDYQADSELNLLCEKPVGKPVNVSEDLFDVLRLSREISKLSDGTFDVTMGPYVRLWRFARKRKVLPGAAELQSARAAVGYRKLKLDERAHTVTLLAPGMRLDVGGVAKGYSADEAMKVLNRYGISSALVAASGDIAVGEAPPGQPGWRVGITGVGANTNRVEHTLILQHAGISTSGDSEQFIEIDGKRYSHILDPKTGLGLTNRIQATVVAPDASHSDPLATAVCILGVTKGMRMIERCPGTGVFILTQEHGEVRAFESKRFKRFPKSD